MNEESIQKLRPGDRVALYVHRVIFGNFVAQAVIVSVRERTEDEGKLDGDGRFIVTIDRKLHLDSVWKCTTPEGIRPGYRDTFPSGYVMERFPCGADDVTSLLSEPGSKK